jgi:hypothetical protein
MSPKERWFGTGLLIVILLVGAVRVALAGCVCQGGTCTWTDSAGWTSKINTAGEYEVDDPNWGYYRDHALGGGYYEHIFICSGQCEPEDSHLMGGTDWDHQSTASGYITQQMQNGCF